MSATKKNQLTIVFYLAGYVFSTFSRRVRFTKKIIRIAQIYCRKILSAGKLGDEKQELLEHKLLNTKSRGGQKQELLEHKLLNTKSRGGLWNVRAEMFEIFCIVEQIFKKNAHKHALIKLMVSS